MNLATVNTAPSLTDTRKADKRKAARVGKRSRTSASTKRRLNVIRRQVKWNLDVIEREYVTVSMIARDDLIRLLRLEACAPSRCHTDKERHAAADNDVQMLIAKELIPRPKRVNGKYRFDVPSLLHDLKLFAEGKIG